MAHPRSTGIDPPVQTSTAARIAGPSWAPSMLRKNGRWMIFLAAVVLMPSIEAGSKPDFIPSEPKPPPKLPPLEVKPAPAPPPAPPQAPPPPAPKVPPPPPPKVPPPPPPKVPPPPPPKVPPPPPPKVPPPPPPKVPPPLPSPPPLPPAIPPHDLHVGFDPDFNFYHRDFHDLLLPHEYDVMEHEPHHHDHMPQPQAYHVMLHDPHFHDDLFAHHRI